MWSLLENNSIIDIHSAHTDNINKVSFLDENYFISGSSDKTIKIWDIRNYDSPVSFISLGFPVQDFAKLKRDDK